MDKSTARKILGQDHEQRYRPTFRRPGYRSRKKQELYIARRALRHYISRVRAATAIPWEEPDLAMRLNAEHERNVGHWKGLMINIDAIPVDRQMTPEKMLQHMYERGIMFTNTPNDSIRLYPLMPGECFSPEDIASHTSDTIDRVDAFMQAGLIMATGEHLRSTDDGAADDGPAGGGDGFPVQGPSGEDNP